MINLARSHEALKGQAALAVARVKRSGYGPVGSLAVAGALREAGAMTHHRHGCMRMRIRIAGLLAATVLLVGA